jgi:hypothetical protein
MGFAESKSQFRAAFQLQFDFHRAVYNLGTVLVSESRLSSQTLHDSMCLLVLYLPWLNLKVTGYREFDQG